MKSHHLRTALIQQFIDNLKTNPLNETITLLAMIGIETVLNEHKQIPSQKNQLVDEIQEIKQQLKLLTESVPSLTKSVPVLSKQDSVSTIKTSDDHSKKSRPLTPKITESRAPNPNQPKRYFVRHHLDDQQMKEALSHTSSEEPSTQKSKSPNLQSNRSNQNIQLKKTPKTAQSIQYFISSEDLKQYNPNIEKTQKNNKYQDTKIQKKYEILKQEAIQKYKDQLKEQEENIKKQQYNCVQDTFAIQGEPKAQAFFDEVPIEDITSFNQSDSNIQQGVQTSNSPNFNSWCPQNNILSLANSLLNSPIIRQMSIKNSNNSSTINDNDKRQKQVTFNDEKYNVQVSGFDTNQNDFEEEDEKFKIDESNLTSNSSAFSLFKPNEELRSFFQKEFSQNVQEDQSNETFHNTMFNDEIWNQEKSSNIFLKGRLGDGSRVF